MKLFFRKFLVHLFIKERTFRDNQKDKAVSSKDNVIEKLKHIANSFQNSLSSKKQTKAYNHRDYKSYHFIPLNFRYLNFSVLNINKGLKWA